MTCLEIAKNLEPDPLSNVKLTDKAWQKIFGFLQEQDGIHLGKEADCRRFVEAVLWILRSGAQ
jgi:hypothetical protein